MPVALSWALASSDPLVESCATRAVGALDAMFVFSLTCLAAVGVAATAVVGPPEMVGLAARDVIGYVGLMLIGRAFLPREAAAVVPVVYLILTAFFAGPTDYGAPMWAWAIRPSSDSATWLIAVTLFALGLGILATDRRIRWADVEA